MEPRKIDLNAESSFEDSKTLNRDVRYGQKRFYKAIHEEFAHFDTITRTYLKNKDVLEIGCSKGDYLLSVSDLAASITGIDISPEAIKSASDSAKKKGVKKFDFRHGDAHKTSFKDKSFDVVLAQGVLHHLDLALITPEIQRVLRENGTLIIIEPLGTNPLFKLYRYLTPKARTVDEKPFSLRDLKFINSMFRAERYRFCGFFSLFAAFFPDNAFGSATRRFLQKVDRLLSFTPLKYMFWVVYAVYRKP